MKTFQPQIMVPALPAGVRLAPAISTVLHIPQDHIFQTCTPEDADFERLTQDGYMVVHAYDAGTFAWMLEGMFDDADMAADRMQALAASLGTPICVDHSPSEAEPHFVAYTADGTLPGISVAEHEAPNGDPYLTSRQFQALLDGATSVG
ncbi:MAG: hypothetical protein AAFQ50_10260 [Pseudomonadota bacterium]